MQHKLVKCLAAGVAASALFAAAPAKAQSAWEGFYLGVQGGFEFGDLTTKQEITNGDLIDPPFDIDEVLPIFAGAGDFDFDGFVGGIHAGYNAVRGNFLFGFEGDLEFTSKNGDTAIDIFQVGLFPTGDPIDPILNTANVGLQAKTEQDFQSSLRGRIGWAGERAMVYATAGVAISQFDQAVVQAFGEDQENIRVDDFSSTEIGYTIGAGVGYLLTDNLSFGAEYRFTDYGVLKSELSDSAFEALADLRDELDTDLQFHSIRTKLAYHF